MLWFKRDWEKIKVGDKVKAIRNVPALMEHAIQFDKNEVAEIAEVQETYVGVRDRFKDISCFAKRRLGSGVDFIGDWFK